MTLNLLDLSIRQVAYFVRDVRAAAIAHRKLFGSGPFLVADRIPLRVSRHRDIDQPLDHTAAYGQWGSIMVEFVQQNDAAPSAFHDLYPRGSGQGGFHHVALIVDDLELEVASYRAEGYDVALYAELINGFAFAMIDMVKELGHMVELHRAAPALVEFYAQVAAMADPSPNGDAFRSVSFG